MNPAVALLDHQTRIAREIWLRRAGYWHTPISDRATVEKPWTKPGFEGLEAERVKREANPA